MSDSGSSDLSEASSSESSLSESDIRSSEAPAKLRATKAIKRQSKKPIKATLDSSISTTSSVAPTGSAAPDVSGMSSFEKENDCSDSDLKLDHPGMGKQPLRDSTKASKKNTPISLSASQPVYSRSVLEGSMMLLPSTSKFNAAPGLFTKAPKAPKGKRRKPTPATAVATDGNNGGTVVIDFDAETNQAEHNVDLNIAQESSGNNVALIASEPRPDSFLKTPPALTTSTSTSLPSDLHSKKKSSANKVKKSGTRGVGRPKSVKRDVYCICRGPYDGVEFMIACDRCEEWFHGRCIGMKPQQAIKSNHYFCDSCQAIMRITGTAPASATNNNSPKIQKKPRQTGLSGDGPSVSTPKVHREKSKSKHRSKEPVDILHSQNNRSPLMYSGSPSTSSQRQQSMPVEMDSTAPRPVFFQSSPPPLSPVARVEICASASKVPVTSTHVARAATAVDEDEEDEDVCPVCEFECTCGPSIPEQPLSFKSTSSKKTARTKTPFVAFEALEPAAVHNGDDLDGDDMDSFGDTRHALEHKDPPTQPSPSPTISRTHVDPFGIPPRGGKGLGKKPVGVKSLMSFKSVKGKAPRTMGKSLKAASKASRSHYHHLYSSSDHEDSEGSDLDGEPNRWSPSKAPSKFPMTTEPAVEPVVEPTVDPLPSSSSLSELSDQEEAFKSDPISATEEPSQAPILEEPMPIEPPIFKREPQPPFLGHYAQRIQQARVNRNKESKAAKGVKRGPGRPRKRRESIVLSSEDERRLYTPAAASRRLIGLKDPQSEFGQIVSEIHEANVEADDGKLSDASPEENTDAQGILSDSDLSDELSGDLSDIPSEEFDDSDIDLAMIRAFDTSSDSNAGEDDDEGSSPREFNYSELEEQDESLLDSDSSKNSMSSDSSDSPESQVDTDIEPIYSGLNDTLEEEDTEFAEDTIDDEELMRLAEQERRILARANEDRISDDESDPGKNPFESSSSEGDDEFDESEGDDEMFYDSQGNEYERDFYDSYEEEFEDDEEALYDEIGHVNIDIAAAMMIPPEQQEQLLLLRHFEEMQRQNQLGGGTSISLHGSRHEPPTPPPSQALYQQLQDIEIINSLSEMNVPDLDAVSEQLAKSLAESIENTMTTKELANSLGTNVDVNELESFMMSRGSHANLSSSWSLDSSTIAAGGQTVTDALTTDLSFESSPQNAVKAEPVDSPLPEIAIAGTEGHSTAYQGMTPIDTMDNHLLAVTPTPTPTPAPSSPTRVIFGGALAVPTKPIVKEAPLTKDREDSPTTLKPKSYVRPVMEQLAPGQAPGAVSGAVPNSLVLGIKNDQQSIAATNCLTVNVDSSVTPSPQASTTVVSCQSTPSPSAHEMNPIVRTTVVVPENTGDTTDDALPTGEQIEMMLKRKLLDGRAKEAMLESHGKRRRLSIIKPAKLSLPSNLNTASDLLFSSLTASMSASTPGAVSSPMDEKMQEMIQSHSLRQRQSQQLLQLQERRKKRQSSRHTDDMDEFLMDESPRMMPMDDLLDTSALYGRSSSRSPSPKPSEPSGMDGNEEQTSSNRPSGQQSSISRTTTANRDDGGSEESQISQTMLKDLNRWERVPIGTFRRSRRLSSPYIGLQGALKFGNVAMPTAMSAEQAAQSSQHQHGQQQLLLLQQQQHNQRLGRGIRKHRNSVSARSPGMFGQGQIPTLQKAMTTIGAGTSNSSTSHSGSLMDNGSASGTFAYRKEFLVKSNRRHNPPISILLRSTLITEGNQSFGLEDSLSSRQVNPRHAFLNLPQPPSSTLQSHQQSTSGSADPGVASLARFRSLSSNGSMTRTNLDSHGHPRRRKRRTASSNASISSLGMRIGMDPTMSQAGHEELTRMMSGSGFLSDFSPGLSDQQQRHDQPQQPQQRGQSRSARNSRSSRGQSSGSNGPREQQQQQQPPPDSLMMNDTTQLPSSACPTPLHSPLFSAATSHHHLQSPRQGSTNGHNHRHPSSNGGSNDRSRHSHRRSFSHHDLPGGLIHHGQGHRTSFDTMLDRIPPLMLDPKSDDPHHTEITAEAVAELLSRPNSPSAEAFSPSQVSSLTSSSLSSNSSTTHLSQDSKTFLGENDLQRKESSPSIDKQVPSASVSTSVSSASASATPTSASQNRNNGNDDGLDEEIDIM